MTQLWRYWLQRQQLKSCVGSRGVGRGSMENTCERVSEWVHRPLHMSAIRKWHGVWGQGSIVVFGQGVCAHAGDLPAGSSSSWYRSGVTGQGGPGRSAREGSTGYTIVSSCPPGTRSDAQAAAHEVRMSGCSAHCSEGSPSKGAYAHIQASLGVRTPTKCLFASCACERSDPLYIHSLSTHQKRVVIAIIKCSA